MENKIKSVAETEHNKANEPIEKVCDLRAYTLVRLLRKSVLSGRRRVDLQALSL